MNSYHNDIMVLQGWFSPAFPTGAFSYSHGLEAAIQHGLSANLLQTLGSAEFATKAGFEDVEKH